jgi:hypothetical protein
MVREADYTISAAQLAYNEGDICSEDYEQ